MKAGVFALSGLVVLLLGRSVLAEEAEGPSEFPAALERGEWLSAIGLHVSAGFAFGGEELVELGFTDGSSTTLQAGEGISLAGGVTWTPLWFADRFGLGLGYDVGWKIGTTGTNADGSANLERVPMSLAVRGLGALAKNFHVVAGVGLTADLSPKLYGDGVLSNLGEVSFQDALGPMFEAGVLFGKPRSLGAEITGRYTLMDYKLMTTSVDASCFSVNATLHFFL